MLRLYEQRILPVVKTWVTSTVNREVAGSNPAAHRCLSDGCSSVAERQYPVAGSPAKTLVRAHSPRE
jgi:hypothetical protein